MILRALIRESWEPLPRPFHEEIHCGFKIMSRFGNQPVIYTSTRRLLAALISAPDTITLIMSLRTCQAWDIGRPSWLAEFAIWDASMVPAAGGGMRNVSEPLALFLLGTARYLDARVAMWDPVTWLLARRYVILLTPWRVDKPPR